MNIINHHTKKSFNQCGCWIFFCFYMENAINTLIKDSAPTKNMILLLMDMKRKMVDFFFVHSNPIPFKPRFVQEKKIVARIDERKKIYFYEKEKQKINSLHAFITQILENHCSDYRNVSNTSTNTWYFLLRVIFFKDLVWCSELCTSKYYFHMRFHKSLN